MCKMQHDFPLAFHMYQDPIPALSYSLFSSPFGQQVSLPIMFPPQSSSPLVPNMFCCGLGCLAPNWAEQVAQYRTSPIIMALRLAGDH